ncbi:MAG: hypothetical protein AAF581_08520 [Planctomycetota bacterium]
MQHQRGTHGVFSGWRSWWRWSGLAAVAVSIGCSQPAAPPHSATHPPSGNGAAKAQATTATTATAATEAPLRVTDLAGNPLSPLPERDSNRLAAFIFTHTDCPVANRYAPELMRIHADFSKRGVDFYLVYVDPALTATEIRTHRTDYGYTMPALRDSYHDLVGVAGALVTPELALFGAGPNLLYCGRIDDRYDDFGKARAEASQHDARDAIEAALAGRTIDPKRTKGVGCYIADIESAAERE